MRTLPQDTNELTGERSWWEKLPEDRKKTARDEKDNDIEVVPKAKVSIVCVGKFEVGSCVLVSLHFSEIAHVNGCKVGLGLCFDYWKFS